MNLDDFDPNGTAVGGGIFGLPFDAESSRVVLIPVPFDATTSYRGGTAQGPKAIFDASSQVDLYDLETGNPWRSGIAMLDIPEKIAASSAQAHVLAEPIKEAGGADPADLNLAQVNRQCDQMTRWVSEQASKLIAEGKIAAVIGGDHSTPLGLIQALAGKYEDFGVLHIDAHADLRHAYQGFQQSHASIMYNVLQRVPSATKLVQVGIRDFCEQEADLIRSNSKRIRTWFDSELAREMFEGSTWASICARIVHDLPKNVYVSFDIDGLEPSLCPNTGTPVPGGLSFNQANYLIGAIVRSHRKIVGFDLCEVASGTDDASIDAVVGARVLYKLVGWSLLGQTGV
jgi:agmatinase